MKIQSFFVLILLFLLTLAVQAALAPHIEIGGVVPDFLLVLTVLLSLQLPLPQATGAALLAGLLQDFWLGRYLGLFTLGKAGGAMVAGWLRKDLYVGLSGVPALLVMLATAVQECWVGGALWLVGRMPPDPAGFARTVLVEALYHALLAVVLYPLIRRLAERLQPDRAGLSDA